MLLPDCIESSLQSVPFSPNDQDPAGSGRRAGRVLKVVGLQDSENCIRDKEKTFTLGEIVTTISVISWPAFIKLRLLALYIRLVGVHREKASQSMQVALLIENEIAKYRNVRAMMRASCKQVGMHLQCTEQSWESLRNNTKRKQRLTSTPVEVAFSFILSPNSSFPIDPM
jgi:hypothetical protein